MKNPYISQALTLKNEVGKLLPNGLETTADMPLEFMSKSDDEQLRASFCRINDQPYHIATRHEETLWDFADALHEYGLFGLGYNTGCADYVFYRDIDGIRHVIKILKNIYKRSRRLQYVSWCFGKYK